MGIIRDLRERIDELESRECSCETHGSWWPLASVGIAFFAAIAVGAYSAAHAPTEPLRPNPSVECIKAGGEWSWSACRKVAK